jgi:hypothetical protein
MSAPIKNRQQPAGEYLAIPRIKGHRFLLRLQLRTEGSAACMFPAEEPVYITA